MGKGTLTVRVLGDARDFESTMGGLGHKAGLAFAAVGAAAIAGAAASIVAFAGFEQRMNEVFTLLPGISQEAMDDLSTQVKNFSREFGVLPDEVIPALYQALSAGVPQDNVFEFLETAQMAAKGGVTELTTAVDGISSVVNAYGSEVLSATEASDLMFTAVRLGKTNFEELSASLFQVTPTASALGVEFGDVTAALAAMTAQGVPTSVATTQLRQLFVELSKAGGTAAKAFEDIAGKSFQEFIASGGDVNQALDLMADAADGSGKQLQDMFGSVEAGQAALALQGNEAFTGALDAMGDSAGATKVAFDQMMTGLGPVFDKVKAFLAVMMIEIGEKLAPILEAAMERIGVAFGHVSDWWDVNGPGIMEWVGKVREAIERFVERVSGAFTAVVKAWKKDGLWGALRELGNQIENAWDEIVYPALVELGKSIRGWFAGLWTDYIKPGLVEVWDSFTEWLNNDGPERLATAMGEMVQALTDWITEEGIPAGEQKLTEMLAAFEAWTLTDGWKQLLGIGLKISLGIVAGIALITMFVSKIAAQILAALFAAAWEIQKQVMVIGLQIGVAIVEGIARGIASGQNIIKGAIQDFVPGGDAISGILNMTIPGNPLGKWLPGNADGTRNWPGGLSWVGERGPELVDLPRGSNVYSNPESMRMTQQQGNEVTIKMDVQGITDPGALAEITARKVGFALGLTGAR